MNINLDKPVRELELQHGYFSAEYMERYFTGTRQHSIPSRRNHVIFEYEITAETIMALQMQAMDQERGKIVIADPCKGVEP